MRDAAKKLLSISWRRAPNGGESHSSPPAVAASTVWQAALPAQRVDRCRHACRRRRRLHGRRLRRHRSARPAEPRNDRITSRPLSSTATTACCAPSRRRTDAGAFPSKPRTSTSATSPCSWRSRTSASTSTAASTCARSRAPPLQLIENGRIVSGGSTLTMQVARLIEGRYERSERRQAAPDRRRAAARASSDKQQILSLYLRLAPFGGNIEGVRAASLAYFGKEPRRLSVGEAALLVALPQSPEWRRPDRNPRAARIARDRVLQRATEEGVITAAEAEPRRARAGADRAPRLPQARAASRRSRSDGRRRKSPFTG